jgi:hypothetical protein
MTALPLSGLHGILARAEAYKDHGTPGLRAPQDRAELLALLEQVAALTEAAKTVHGRLALRDDIKKLLT